MAENRNCTTTFRENLQCCTLNKSVQRFRRRQTDRQTERDISIDITTTQGLFLLCTPPPILLCCFEWQENLYFTTFSCYNIQGKCLCWSGKGLYVIIHSIIFFQSVYAIHKIFLVPHSVYIVSKQNIISICMHLRHAVHFQAFINCCICINNVNTITWIALGSPVTGVSLDTYADCAEKLHKAKVTGAFFVLPSVNGQQQERDCMALNQQARQHETKL